MRHAAFGERGGALCGIQRENAGGGAVFEGLSQTGGAVAGAGVCDEKRPRAVRRGVDRYGRGEGVSDYFAGCVFYPRAVVAKED